MVGCVLVEGGGVWYHTGLAFSMVPDCDAED
jgi:hypothetical protein